MKSKLLGGVTLLFLVGCHGAPSVTEVADATAQAAEAVGTEGASQIDSSSGLTVGTSLSNGWTTASTMLKVSPMAPLRLDLLDPTRAGAMAPIKLPRATMESTTAPTPAESWHAQMQALAQFLRTRIFIEANVESRDGDATIFRIKGDDVCAAGDIDCIISFDRIEVRLSATKPAHGIDVTLLLGPDRFAPYRIQLSSDFLSLTTDLGQLRSAYVYVAGATGGSTYGLPDVMEGQFELRADRHGEHDYSLTANVPLSIRIETTDAATGAHYAVSTAARSPVGTFRYDTVHQHVIAAVDLGPTDYSYPYSPSMSATGNAGDQLALHLDGISYAFDYTEGDGVLNVTQVGLGDAQTSLKLDGNTLVSYDLNGDAGRHFDLQVTVDPVDNQPIVQVAPKFSLVTAYHKDLLASDTDVYVAPYELNETYTFSLDSAAAPTVKSVPADSVTGFPGGLKVIAGTLTLATDKSGTAPVVVNAGECLTGNAAPAADAHPLLGQYSVVACP